MKILEFKLLAFGPFSGLTLDLAGGDHGLHLIYGPNEAGKSASLRALTALFYGIPVRTADNFLHDNQDLRLGARIRHSDGAELQFLRRKGSRDTLLDAGGRPIPESSLVKFLSGAGEELFTTMFGIDHGSLVRGGEQVLKGGGAIGESLFAAGLGGTDLRELLRSLDEEAGRLFLPRGRAQLIMTAVNGYKEAKHESLQASLSVRAWTEQHDALREATQQLEHIDAELRGIESERHRLDRFRKALPRMGERKELLARLAALGKVRPLAPNFGKIRRDAMHGLDKAWDTEKGALEALANINRNMAPLEVPEALLQQAETVTQLHERLGSHRKAFKDLPRLQGEKQQLTADAQALLRELRPDLELQAVETLRLTVAKRARIRELGNRWQAVEDQLRRCRSDAEKLAGKLTAARDEEAQLAPFRDVSSLRLAHARAMKQGNVEEDLNTALQALRVDAGQLQLEVGRLGWLGSVEELEALPIPAPETLDRFEADIGALERELYNLGERMRESEERSAVLGVQMDELRLAGPVPSEDDLAAARAHRDHGWTLVRRAWLEGGEDPAATEAFAAGNSLADAYQRSVGQADQIADRLRREADRVAGQAALMAQRRSCLEELEGFRLKKTELQSRMDRLSAAWRVIWQPLGITPLTPKEMRSWLGRYDRLMQLAQKLRMDRARADGLQRRIDEQRAGLSQRLQELGEPATAPEETLEPVMQRAQNLVALVEDTERKRKDLRKTGTRLQEELDAALRSREEAAAALSRWQQEWTAAVGDLGLSPGAAPAEANAVLDKLEELFKKIDQLTGLTDRISGIVRDGEEFERDARDLARRLAPQPAENPAEVLAVELHQRLQKAREDAATLAQLREQQKEKETLIERARTAMRQCQLQLQELCREASCAGFDELEEMEQRSTTAQALRKDVDGLEKLLLDFSGGATLEQFVEEAAQVDGDMLPARIADLTRRIEELTGRRAALQESIGGIKHRLDLMDGRAEAAEAAQRAQASLAEIRAHANHYLRLRLASALMHREIERYRAENQDPLLRRSGEIFAGLSAGSFTALQADYNEMDQPILLGVRPGGERVVVQGMSEGTRDQLYLALRLASLEKYMQAAEPMPLILDDILVNFDDQRALATLRVLDELSHTTQIIFFTHHAHLVELARAGVAPASLFLHNLTQDAGQDEMKG